MGPAAAPRVVSSAVGPEAHKCRRSCGGATPVGRTGVPLVPWSPVPWSPVSGSWARVVCARSHATGETRPSAQWRLRRLPRWSEIALARSSLALQRCRSSSSTGTRDPERSLRPLPQQPAIGPLEGTSPDSPARWMNAREPICTDVVGRGSPSPAAGVRFCTAIDSALVLGAADSCGTASRISSTARGCLPFRGADTGARPPRDPFHRRCPCRPAPRITAAAPAPCSPAGRRAGPVPRPAR